MLGQGGLGEAGRSGQGGHIGLAQLLQLTEHEEAASIGEGQQDLRHLIGLILQIRHGGGRADGRVHIANL